jgi:hypothetical protein
MSFMGFFPSTRERRLAHDEAADAIDKHGNEAAIILLQKARQTRSTERRAIYRQARKFVMRRDS